MPSLDFVLLTDNIEPYNLGLVTYANKALMWDSNSRKLPDFTCHFSFSIDTPSSMGGDGIVFVGFQIPLNSCGGYLGLFNTTTKYSSSSMIISMEFDTLKNDWDPKNVGAHVGININSVSSTVYTPWNASSYIDDTADVLITYNSTTKNLSVSWRYQITQNPQERSIFSHTIDLREILSNWVTIGFLACTRGYCGQ
ncbi:hypothetical protein SLA2020_181080 [Shorea laevis]